MMKFNYTNIIFFLKLLLIILIILTSFSIWQIRITDFNKGKYLDYSSELRVLTQRIGKRVGEIFAFGFENSFTSLQTRQAQFDKIIKILINGEYNADGMVILPPSPSYIQQGSLGKLNSYWEESSKQIDMILSNKELIKTSQKAHENIQAKLDKISSIYWEVLKKIPSQDLGVDILLNISNQIEYIEKLSGDFQELLTLTILTPEIQTSLPIKVRNFAETADKIYDENKNKSAVPLLNNINTEILSIQQSLDDMLKTGFILDSVYDAAQNLSRANLKFLEYTDHLYDDYTKYSKHRFITRTIINILTVGTILVLIALGYLLNRRAKLDLSITEKKNRKINQDIETLLQEISDLAGGNLAIKATVCRGITEEIAKSINYAIEALRKLVLHINLSSQKASDMSLETQKLTHDLALASEKQLNEIIRTVQSIQSTEKLAEKVSLHANESAVVARQSVELASEGGIEVRNTMDGMVRIQDQIRATSNKMLRLNDRSNEIGQIITMIDGIAEQTNILSLNASIQAAMAGDAGLGFAVVADEVQRLAEKVRYATQEVELLINSIQQETQAVIGSMEKTRIETKQGGELAQNAGDVLEKIEFVSKNLAKHIQSISLLAEKQSKMSSSIASMMSTIESISKNIAVGSINTADFTSKLTGIVSDLRSSVSEFKLYSSSEEE